MGNLRQIGRTGVLLNKNLKDVTDPAVKEALKKILGEIKAKKEKPKNKKNQKNLKKIKDVETT